MINIVPEKWKRPKKKQTVKIDAHNKDDYPPFMSLYDIVNRLKK